jgi:hypothetical protein
MITGIPQAQMYYPYQDTLQQNKKSFSMRNFFNLCLNLLMLYAIGFIHGWGGEELNNVIPE